MAASTFQPFSFKPPSYVSTNQRKGDLSTSEKRAKMDERGLEKDLLKSLYGQAGDFATSVGLQNSSASQGYGALAQAMANEASNWYGANAMAESARQSSLANTSTGAMAAYGNLGNSAMQSQAMQNSGYMAALAQMQAANQAATSNLGGSLAQSQAANNTGYYGAMSQYGSALAQAKAAASAAQSNAQAQYGGAFNAAQSNLGQSANNAQSNLGQAYMMGQAQLGSSANNALGQWASAVPMAQAQLGSSANAAQSNLGQSYNNAQAQAVASMNNAQGQLGTGFYNTQGQLGSSANNANASISGAFSGAQGQTNASANNAMGQVGQAYYGAQAGLGASANQAMGQLGANNIKAGLISGILGGGAGTGSGFLATGQDGNIASGSSFGGVGGGGGILGGLGGVGGSVSAGVTPANFHGPEKIGGYSPNYAQNVSLFAPGMQGTQDVRGYNAPLQGAASIRNPQYEMDRAKDITSKAPDVERGSSLRPWESSLLGPDAITQMQIGGGAGDISGIPAPEYRDIDTKSVLNALMESNKPYLPAAQQGLSQGLEATSQALGSSLAGLKDIYGMGLGGINAGMDQFYGTQNKPGARPDFGGVLGGLSSTQNNAIQDLWGQMYQGTNNQVWKPNGQGGWR